MEDKQIVDLYWDRSEQAIEETSKKYDRYCSYIAYQILRDEGYAMEVVNDTYLKTWNTIPDNRPDNLKSYLGMICRQLAIDKYRHEKTRSNHTQAIIEELGESMPDIGENIDLVDCLNSFLWSLPKKARDIFIRRYWYADSINEIARDFLAKESAITMSLHRSCMKLKEKLENEGIEL